MSTTPPGPDPVPQPPTDGPDGTQPGLPTPPEPTSAAGTPAQPAPSAGAPSQPAPGAGAPAAGADAPRQTFPEQPTAPLPYTGPFPYAAPPAGDRAAPPAGDPADPFRVPSVGPTGHVGPTDTTGASPTPTRPRRGWVPVVTAAVVAAVLASVGTTALSGGFSDNDTTRPTSLSTVGTSRNPDVPVSGGSTDTVNWQAVAAAVQASVVAIAVQTGSGAAQGSGVVVDTAGHVMTNNHVVEGAQGGAVTVTLSDGRIFSASVVGTDATTDLAVIALKDAPSDLTAAQFGNSDDVQVGQPVMAVGNPLGLANTVTTGIVSAVDRPVSTASQTGTGDPVVTNAIQIDAAINPGNSGGPLFDAQGQVVGITSSIATLSSSSGSIGLGFAIPANLARSVGDQLIRNGTAEHAFLGVSLTDGTATADGVTRRGAVVQKVSAGSPAAVAGLQVGDTVVAIGKDPVGGAESLTAFVRSHAGGETVTLTVVRNGKAMDVDVTLATRQEQASSSSGGSGSGGSDQGGSQQPGGSPGGLSPKGLWDWLQQQGGGQG